MVRDGKPTGFFYLDHRTVDGKHAIITDTHVTPASVHDSVPYLARLDHQCQRFGLDPVGVGLDAGYFTAAICHGLEERGLYGVIGYRRPSKLKGYLPLGSPHFPACHRHSPPEEVNKSGIRASASGALLQRG